MTIEETVNSENVEDAKIDNKEKKLVLFSRSFNFANAFIGTS
jgi:hypothetical protein